MLSPRGRGRATGVVRETLDALERVGEDARMWRKDFKLNEFAGSGLVGDVELLKGELGEILEAETFDHERGDVFLLE